MTRSQLLAAARPGGSSANDSACAVAPTADSPCEQFGEEPAVGQLLMAESRHKSLRLLQRYVHPSAEAVAAMTAAHDPAARRRR